MMSKSVQINFWMVGSLLLAIFLLVLATAPDQVNAVDYGINMLEAGDARNIALCENAETIVLGREGGLLSLLDENGYAEPVEAIVKGEGYSRQVVDAGQRVPYVAYVRNDC